MDSTRSCVQIGLLDPPEESQKKVAQKSHYDCGSDSLCVEQEPFLPGLDDEAALRCLVRVPISDLVTVAMVNRRYRSLINSRRIFELRQRYGALEHWLIISIENGLGVEWIAYDINHNNWRSLRLIDIKPIPHCESVCAGTHVLWVDYMETFNFRYDFFTQRWKEAPTMVNPRSFFASASNGKFVYVAGGVGRPHKDMVLKALRSAERYSYVSGTWETLAPMSMPREKCAGFFMNRKFYVIGGGDNSVRSAEEYNPVTRNWRTIENMYFAESGKRASPPLVAVVDNCLYAVEMSTNTLKLYENHSNTWRNVGLLPVQTDIDDGCDVVFKSLGDRLFIMGDMGGECVGCCWWPNSVESEAEWHILFQWEKEADSQTRVYHTLSLLSC